jgi:outer membrane protein assembly factor BamD (BamD/ComL family)
MSIVGILASNLFAAGAAHFSGKAQNSGSDPSQFQQIKTEFQQLGQDLQAGNLTQARQDYTALSQNLPSSSQSSTSPELQAFKQLGTELQAGNLQAAQKDFTTVQQDVQQIASQVHGHHHHHHHAVGSQDADSGSAKSTAVSQAFGTLGRDLQAGNLAGAQAAFAALQNDLQQIGGFLPPIGPSSIASATAPGSTGNLNVTA